MRISFTTYNHEITRNYFLANQKQSHSSKILVFFCKSFMIVLKRALEFIYLFFANWGLFVCDFCFYLNTFVFPDPPEIELETDRVHSGENKEAHLTCLIHGNPTPTVSQAFLVFIINAIPIWYFVCIRPLLSNYKSRFLLLVINCSEMFTWKTN